MSPASPRGGPPILEEGGATFSLRAPRASAVDLCLFSEAGEETRLSLAQMGEVWQRQVEGVRPGQLYGYRVDGPYSPGEGHRFNPQKLLLDPAALAVHGELRWGSAIFGYGRGGPWGDRRSGRDSAGAVPRSVVIDRGAGGVSIADPRSARPRTPWSRTVIYEAHVRGLTRRHPDVPEQFRGTYLGLAEPPVLDHLLSLGVTAVQLLPVQQSASEGHLARWGAHNYWGYSPLAWFAPHAGYATGSRGEQVAEFQTMVSRLHEAGLEVLLDVVFNHTVEGDEHGPTLSLRGLDNECYYRHVDGRGRDFTGCGNTLDFSRTEVVDLVVDCLRYWVEEMQVDGFRFDLGTVLGRDPESFDPKALFFERVAAEPSLRPVKLIAEPWDLGPDSYALGKFPPGWAQWNDRFRDAARRSWCLAGADPGAFEPEELARRVGGSTDLFDLASGEGPSLDFVTCHDGFTLADQVSYQHKVNWANGEGNRDGSTHDLSTNCGVEGATGDARVLACRQRAQRNLLATLALTRGVPMLSHGDELGRTQGGNNNAYCQDNLTSWVDWQLDPPRRDLLAFTRQLFSLRRQLEQEAGDVAAEMTVLASSGCVAQRVGAWLVLFNPTGEECTVELPPSPGSLDWRWQLDTACEGLTEGEANGEITIAARSVAVLRAETASA